MGKGRGLNIFSQIEPNWPLPYSTMPLPWLRDARPKGWVNCFSICASTMPRAQNWTAKCSILKEDKILCPSGYIIYLCKLPIAYKYTNTVVCINVKHCLLRQFVSLLFQAHSTAMAYQWTVFYIFLLFMVYYKCHWCNTPQQIYLFLNG